ncbi:RNA exonuclease KNAG_0L00550 [Huiozyma naganishii CBS 8797]|uniref:Endonuclease/exonuclease/phosphatase domain-containing protein n=1 Tax=Huiozyma naganishii (strain ATCC MYA-139 / BCRC 22969 / CBS 8797 / KCTC 17520 / NBRC 10181 / NCYC 3082 / Yp74L-3) TaxID=1071383 RepID=J7RS12_HUIN7|nr:hypothetical protein KNAG_0L00550 [Kazachstania naganishii CBS 8797]CCK72678.1 hypothetical protein KNAG_0L00550 [Kazachstania naganishii CBS 8797]
MFRRRFIPVKHTVNLLKKPSPGNGVPPLPGALPKHDNRFTLLTYNILSPAYMWPQVYTYVPEQCKQWEFRHDLLEQELLGKYKADIMCIQEMTKRDYQQFWSPIASGKCDMGSEFISKTAPKYWKREPDELDGVAIFYNRKMFDFVSSKGIYLNQMLDAFNDHELEYLGQKKLGLTDGAGNPTGETNLLNFLKLKNQVSLFVSLQHKSTGMYFVVINTHLYWKYDEVKLTQCMVIMRELSQIIDDLLKDVPDVTKEKVKIIFTGDLNSTKNSPVINFLRGNIISHLDLNMVNPMKPFLNRCVYDDAPEEWFDNTCYSGKLKGIFDYIWYHDTDLKLTKILTGKEVSDELDEASQRGLPNGTHPSDHIPVLTEFKILNQSKG